MTLSESKIKTSPLFSHIFIFKSHHFFSADSAQEKFEEILFLYFDCQFDWIHGWDINANIGIQKTTNRKEKNIKIHPVGNHPRRDN